MLGFKAHGARSSHPIDIGIMEGVIEKKKGDKRYPFFSSLFSFSPNTSLVNLDDDDTTDQIIELIPGRLRCREVPCHQILYARSKHLRS